MAPVIPRSTEPGGRRSRRPWRTTTALLLLALAVVTGGAAILVGSVPVLVGGIVLAVLLGSAAARLLGDETVQVRRDWSQDRAAQAHAVRRDAEAKAREHIDFADTMAERVRVRQSQVEDLAAQLERVREDAAAQVLRADAAEREVALLRTQLEEAHAELLSLQEALAASQSEELDARTQLLAWQQSDEARRYA